MNGRKSQYGFTLIELIVSLGLGLLIAAAATQLFVTNVQGFNAQRGISDVQDNGRFALDFINRDVRQAGVAPAGSSVSPYPPVVTDIADMPGATPDLLTMGNVASPGLGASDQLVIQRLALVDSVDCEGNAVLAGQYIVSRYFLRADVASEATSALACDGGSHNTTVLSGIGDAGIVLLGSVENMQVQLGVGNAEVPVRYLRPEQYPAPPAPRPQILTVRLGALVASVDTTGDQMGEAPDLNVLDALVNDIPADGRIRRVFVTSVALRNQL